MSELAAFQEAFWAALAGDRAEIRGWIQGDGAGLAVYRNTCLKGAIDALEANFPTVAALVGTEWFRAAAREHVAAFPPDRPALHAYGAHFPDWLEAFPPAAALPYLPAVARLDRLWSEALFAPDAPRLEAQALAALDAQALAHTCARLHPAARLAWLEDNSPALWLETRWPAEIPVRLEFVPQAQGVLVWRAHEAVRSRIIGASEFAFLSGCRRGRTLAEAARAALEARADADLPTILSAGLTDGLFTALETLP